MITLGRNAYVFQAGHCDWQHHISWQSEVQPALHEEFLDPTAPRYRLSGIGGLHIHGSPVDIIGLAAPSAAPPSVFHS